MKRLLIGLAAMTGFGVILAATSKMSHQPNYTPAQNGHQSHQLPCEMCGINPRIPGKSLCKECERIALADQHKETALKTHKSHNKAKEEHKKTKTKHAQANPPKKKTTKTPTPHKPPKTHVTKPPKPPKTIPSPVYGPFLPGQWPTIPAPPPKHHHKPKVPTYGPTKP